MFVPDIFRKVDVFSREPLGRFRSLLNRLVSLYVMLITPLMTALS